jgi:hypothetical protein
MFDANYSTNADDYCNLGLIKQYYTWLIITLILKINFISQRSD